MKNIKKVLILIFCTNMLVAQSPCEGRYNEEIFDQVEVTTVTYSDVHNLAMDIYQPVGDTETNRPLIIFGHGGTFITGSKDNSTAVDFCEAFAKRGYVTASINYRLAEDIVGFFNQFIFYTDTQMAYEVVLNAVMDGKAAIRYFRKDVTENGNTYGIDASQIWGGGNSAGGVLFLHAGHVESIEEFIEPLDANRADIAESIFETLGGVEGNSGNAGYSSEIAGVISLAGALHRSEYVTSDDIPSVFCHGNADSVVPYDCNGFQNNPSYDQLCGGGALFPVFEMMGVNTDLLTFANDDHCPWSVNSSKMDQVISFVSDFMYNNIDCEQSTLLNESLIENAKLIYQIDLLGRSIQKNTSGFVFNIYNNGITKKRYIIK